MHNSGGMERVLSVCANALCKVFDVSFVTLYQRDRPYFYLLDDAIHTFDLGLNNVSNKRLLKEKLTEFLMQHHFDIVVSLGGIDMYYLHSIKDGSKKIIWFHFAYNVTYTAWLGEEYSLRAKIKGYLQHIRRIHHAKRYDQIIVLSEADAKAWKRHSDRVSMIYNPVTINNPIVSKRDAKSVISVGRLDYAKGFDLLISAWELVNKKHSDWSLNIYGDGDLKTQLQEQINRLKLAEKIKLCGRTTNIANCYCNHSIYVMCSRSEALGLVLLEASSCGLPLISFDCPSGPREIIEDGKNGILVKPLGDINKMAEAINRLIENPTQRNHMGDKAFNMVNSFSLNNIIEQWVNLFHQICSLK